MTELDHLGGFLRRNESDCVAHCPLFSAMLDDTVRQFQVLVMTLETGLRTLVWVHLILMVCDATFRRDLMVSPCTISQQHEVARRQCLWQELCRQRIWDGLN